MAIVKYLFLGWEAIKLNILSAMEYRAAFITQIVGMAVNDVALVIVWILFFKQFPDLSGWGLSESLVLFSFSSASFGFMRIFCAGIEELARMINRGELDYFLTLPKNVLWQISVSKSDVTGIGEYVFAIPIFLLSGYATVGNFFLFLLLTVIGGLIMYNFLVAVHTLGFYFGNFEEGADRLLHSLLGFSLYPATPFGGLIKIISFTVLPVFFIVWMPVELIKFFTWQSFLSLIGFWALSLVLAIFFFNRGLKRYESGNLINVRM